MQRGRGRARGRAGTGSEGGQQQQQQPPRRPGEAPGQGPPQPGPRQPPPAAFGAPVTAPVRPGIPPSATSVGGRSTHRSIHPGPAGDEPGDLVRPMAGVDLGERGAGGARSRGSMRQLPETILKTRPSTLETKKGKSGNPVNILANYYTVLTAPKWSLHQYHVDITPTEDRTFVKKILLREHRAKLGGYLYDGTVLYSVTSLSPDPMELFSKRNSDNQMMRIVIKRVNQVTAGDYHYIQVFNIIMRRCYNSLKMQLVGRDYYDANAKVEIPEYKLQVWPGFKTTINQHEDSILMVVEVAHKMLRRDTVHNMLSEYAQTKGGNYQRAFTEDIVGQVVMSDYNNNTYHVDDVDFRLNPSSTFVMKGESVTYADYYKKKYDITIRDMKQPLLMSRTKPREIRAGGPEVLYLIPELCRQTGLTDSMRNNFQLMKALATHTKLGPDARVRRLMNFNKRILGTPAAVKELEDWDMRLDNKLVTFMGRILPTENIVQGTRGEIKYPAGNTNEGWTRDMRSKPLLSAGNLATWALLTPQNIYNDAIKFAKMISDTARAVGFTVNKPEIVTMQGDRSTEYTSQLENIIARLNPSLILVCLMRQQADRYEAIKKKCCIERAVPTQVVVGRSLTNKNAMSIATKVAIQINCKVGGAPWTVENPLKGLMVIGYDVCHDTRDKSKSFGAMVASLDPTITSYYNVVNAHRGGEELSQFMEFNVKMALKTFAERNGGCFPSRIIVYRDGVGEGQIPFVHDNEVKSIRKACSDMYKENPYKMAFVVVSKRINTRLFLQQGNGAPQNPPPGTIVDDVITLPERYDFFLVSQAVREGTVAPTSYNVIYDNLGLDADKLQKLTYKMCHIYFNCSNHVRVPAVCQYAHKLAFLAAQSLHNTPLASLNTSLFFL